MKMWGIPKLGWADQVKFEFWGHFGGQNGQKAQIAKNQWIFFVILETSFDVLSIFEILL